MPLDPPVRPRSLAVVVGLVLVAGCASAQPAPAPPAAPSGAATPTAVPTEALRGTLPPRPVPHPVLPPPSFERAVAAGTRTLTGHPGPRYWQNRADYSLTARIDTTTGMLDGSGTARFTNGSPDTLRFVVVKLHQNLHAPDALRNRFVEVTGGMELTRLSVGGRAATSSAPALPQPGQYRIDGTVLTLNLPAPLLPGQTAELGMDWRFRIPQAGPQAVRMGRDHGVVYLGYWYPQIAVYDDVFGWDAAPYLGLGEHYMTFGDWDVTVDAPAGMLVQSTGTLLNAAEVYSARTRERLARARSQDAVVRVVGPGELAGALTPASGRRTWRFRAENVRDVAVSATAGLWDATRAVVPGRAEPVEIHSVYRPGARTWERSAEFSRFSIEHLSALLGYAYPWAHMTAVEGVITGGMEYPMMTLIGGNRNDLSLFGVTYHEIAHMWYPMIVGTNEKAYTWIDEGLTSYNTNEGIAAFFDGSAPERPLVDAFDPRRESHYAFAGTGFAVEPMRHNDLFPPFGGTPQVNPVGNAPRVVASYSTPAVFFRMLEGLVGRERFYAAYHELARRWAFKHPTPWDLFNTFEDVLGDDLDWLWTPTLFDTWTLDHAVGVVRESPAGVEVVVRDLALAPVPAPVVVTYADGRTERQTVPVSVWLGGAREHTLRFPAGRVARVEIDPEGYLIDVDRPNNVWTPAR